MATQAEQASTKNDPGPWEEFEAWANNLRTPPVFTLADTDTVCEAMMAKLRAEFRAAVTAEQWLTPTADGGDSDVPFGWDSDTLLLEMAASDRAG